jgi:hypothetical protein
MSADIANTTLASAPYYDDFDETKKFHRVLFRPSFPVQARELTQLQTILQNQIERFGDGVFKQGSIIKGCAPTVIPDAVYVAVPNSNATFNVSNTSYVGAILYGANSGVQARILKGELGFAATSDPSKFFVKYTSTGRNGVTGFQEGETIVIYGEDKSYLGTSVITVANATNFSVNSRIRGTTSDARGLITAANTTSNEITITNVRKDFTVGETIQLLSNTSVSTTVSAIELNFSNNLANTTVLTTPGDGRYTAVGNAYALSVSEGIVYQKGFFVKTDTQTLILNASAGGPSAANGIVVGMETTETVVDEFADSSLYDNSADLSNGAAPGAHRLKLETNFVSYAKTALPNTEVFFAVAEFGPDNILRWNNTSVGGAVGQEMAQRTYDESGHYTVKDFTITSKPSANTQEFYYDIGAGKAYVRGNSVDFKSNQVLSSRRGVDTESPVQQIVSMNYGSYVTVEELRGYFPADQSASVNLYDSFQNAITASLNSSSSATGSVIGTANIRNLVYDTDSADKGAPLAQYNMYLFNVKMNENQNFNKVRSIVYQGTANAFSDVAVSQLANSVYTVTISANGGGYANGETVTINGGLGDAATALLTVNNASGNVTSIALIQGGKYTANPTLSGAAVTGGSGTGLTVNLTVDGFVDPKLEATDYTALVFGLTNRAVKNLKDSANNSDTEFYYNAAIDASLANNGTTTISLTDGGSFFGFSDNTDFSEEKVDIVLTGAALTTVNLDGTVSVANSTTTTITGTSTFFQRDFVVGEKITVAGNTAVIVNSIVSNTTMTTRTAHGAAAVANTYARFHEKGSIISLSTSNRTIALNSTLQSLTVDLGPDFTASGATAIKVNAYTRKSNARPIAKEIKRNQLVRFYNGSLAGTIATSGNTVTGTSTAFSTDFKVGNYIKANGETKKVTAIANTTQLSVDTAFSTSLSANTYEIVHPYGFNLGVPDVLKINRVSKTKDLSSDNNQAVSDIKQYFTYDFGQRDTHYDHAVLYPKSTANLSNSYLIVDFDCFAANATLGKGFFSVESYSVNDAIGANTSQYVRTWEIPSYYSATRNRRFDLRDSIDFRPYRANTANLTSNASATTTNPPPGTIFNPATTDYNPYPGQNFECNLTYYLPRRDAVVLTSKGVFEVVEGISAIVPRSPRAESDDQMVIATTYVPPYPSLTIAESQYVINAPYTMFISPIFNKRYRMKDIAAIDQRVSSLEYFTTLTRLEQKATQLNIPDENGVDRFKNGFFVDPFDNHNLTRLGDSEHTIVIDPVIGVGRPGVSTETVEIEINNANSTSTSVIRDTANNISYSKNFVTVGYDANIKFASQDYATREIAIDPNDKYDNGVVELDKTKFADVEQSLKYPVTTATVTPTTTQYNEQYIYPLNRTVKLIARGLKPSTRHYISIDNVDYSSLATPGNIAYGVSKVASNVTIDGLQGEALYSDSTGVLYAIAIIPGNLSLGNHVLSVTDVVSPATPSSRALGAFVVSLVEQIPEEPVVEPPLVPKTPLIVADFDVVGTLVVEDGTSHTLSFIDKTNRGVIAPEGSTLEAPVSWEWTFVQCSTGCVTPSSANSSAQNPSNIAFTFPSMIETVYVKLKVTGNNSTVSEVVKPVQLTKFESDGDLKLTLINVINPESHYYMSDASTLKAVNWINIEFRGEMTANRVTGGYVTIGVVGNAGSGSLSGTNFSATNIGTASITLNQVLLDGGRSVGIGWSNPANTTLTVTATYYSSAAVVLATTQKTISFTNDTSLEPCKPCDPTQVPIATVPEGPGAGPGGGAGGSGDGALRYTPSIIGGGFYLSTDVPWRTVSVGVGGEVVITDGVQREADKYI